MYMFQKYDFIMCPCYFLKSKPTSTAEAAAEAAQRREIWFHEMKEISRCLFISTYSLGAL